MTQRINDAPAPSPSRGWERRKRRGFTLIEIVLAIGLTAMVVYLLTTAMELYLTNVDASRGRVESAQLARTLLDQIAADLAAVRTAPPPMPTGGPAGGGFQMQSGGAMSGGGGQPSFGGQGGSQSGASAGGSQSFGGTGAGGGTAMGPGVSGPSGGGAPLIAQGLFGAVEQLRIDRAAYANWERIARELDPQEGAAAADLPMTVRYFFAKDNRTTAQRLAQQGVAREASATAAAGLYRETIPTAAIEPRDPPLPTGAAVRGGAQVELLAPEVVAFELAYYNGTDLVEEWDPVIDRGLPRGVEIRLTIAEPAFQARPSQEEQQRLADGRYRESELVEYRRYVRLPIVGQLPAMPLLPVAQQGGGPQQPSGQPGQPGQGGPGGGQPGGAPQGGAP